MSEFEAGQERAFEGRALVSGTEAPVAQAARSPLGTASYGVPAQGDEVPLAVIVRQYLYMVVKRKWLILGVALAFTVLGGVRTLMQTPLYMATVRIQIEREAAQVVEHGSTSPIEFGATDFLKTQYELLKSRGMAERVVSALRITEDASFFRPRDLSLLGIFAGSSQNSLPSAEARHSWAAGIVHANVIVSPVPGSRLADISYADPNPARAQKIANGYADAYIESNLDKRFEANAYAKKFLEDQIKQLKIRLEESEKAVLDFSEREKMVEVTDKASIAENNLAAANAAAGQLISERMKNEQLWRQVESVTAINLPQFLSNPVIEVLRGQRKALETEYQEKLESFKPAYPAMVQIRNKIKEIDKQLAAETGAIRNSLKAAYESAALPGK